LREDYVAGFETKSSTEEPFERACTTVRTSAAAANLGFLLRY
jgi:hypothetical protein